MESKIPCLQRNEEVRVPGEELPRTMFHVQGVHAANWSEDFHPEGSAANLRALL